jgi:UDP-N-acetylmuramate: L-alanyl-gamma-D-glutamyl-meso-diaminopimelate ligase
VQEVVRKLGAKGKQASAIEAVPAIVEQIAREARPNDVVLVMSNGAFGGLIPELLSALEKRSV